MQTKFDRAGERNAKESVRMGKIGVQSGFMMNRKKQKREKKDVKYRDRVLATYLRCEDGKSCC